MLISSIEKIKATWKKFPTKYITLNIPFIYFYSSDDSNDKNSINEINGFINLINSIKKTERIITMKPFIEVEFGEPVK